MKINLCPKFTINTREWFRDCLPEYLQEAVRAAERIYEEDYRDALIRRIGEIRRARLFSGK